MTITINDMLALSNFLDAHRNDTMAMKTAFKFNKLAAALESDMRLFQEKYQELINKYADLENSAGMPDGTFKIKEGEFDNYMRETNELSAVEIEIPNVKIAIDELEHFSVTMDEVRQLMAFLED